jgi:hypothetical protein
MDISQLWWSGIIHNGKGVRGLVKIKKKVKISDRGKVRARVRIREKGWVCPS